MAEVSFHCLQDGTKADFNLMAKAYQRLCSPEDLSNRAITMLTNLRGIYGGAKIDLYDHSLQTATRAYRNNESTEAIVCCLLHDIGEMVSPSNHGEIPAAILKPYISEKWYWILANHEVFQGYYYFHLVGGDRNTRDVFKDSPFYQDCADFCELYDAPSFDPDYTLLSLDLFRPMIHEVFSRRPYLNDPSHPKALAVTGAT